MALIDLTRSLIGFANNFTKSQGLAANVTYERAPTTQDAKGKRPAVAPVTIQALVEMKQQLVRAVNGELIMSQAKLTLLDPSIVVQLSDKFTLPDGTTGPILNFTGYVDGGTGHPVLSEVFLG